MAKHVVGTGECISSIAHQHGFFWQTLWEHPENAVLKEKRGDPNVLMPGEDEVFIPDKHVEPYVRPTGKRHRFQRKGVPAKLRIRFTSGKDPRAGVPYTLAVDGKPVSRPGARTDGDGWVECSISPVAREGKLVLGEGDDRIEYNLRLGHLNPVDQWSGVKQRLANLGFYEGPFDDAPSAAAAEAISAFQASVGAAPTGELDDGTRSALREAHEP